MKQCNIGKAGMILVNVWCKDCDSRHLQYKYPCVCENGRVTIDPLGYKTCTKCDGRGYINEMS